jgi:purine-binding chemotaxis protein CheW
MNERGAPIVRRENALPSSRSAAAIQKIADSRREFLIFEIGTERMGLPLASVKEILKLSALTEVPRAAEDVMGILSVRGRITTVLALRRRLGMGEARPTRHTRILLLDGGAEIMGIVVDAVLHVVRLRDDEIEPAHVVASDVPEHVLGLGRPRRREGRGAGAGAGASARADLETAPDEVEVIVLLDPVALLKR